LAKSHDQIAIAHASDLRESPIPLPLGITIHHHMLKIPYICHRFLSLVLQLFVVSLSISFTDKRVTVGQEVVGTPLAAFRHRASG
jgi:hypothetical protein